MAGIVAAFVLALSAAASALPTSQGWTFDRDPNTEGGEADFFNNPFGTPRLGVTMGSVLFGPSTGGVGLAGLSDSDQDLVFTIPNDPRPRTRKFVRILIDYDFRGPNSDRLRLPSPNLAGVGTGGFFIGVPTDSPSPDRPGYNRFEARYAASNNVCPPSEQLTIRGPTNGRTLLLDNVLVLTDCGTDPGRIPEPATLPIVLFSVVALAGLRFARKPSVQGGM